MYSKQELINSIIFDIETCPKCKYAQLTTAEKELWNKKYYKRSVDRETEEILKRKAAESGEYFTGFKLKDKESCFYPEEIFIKYAPLYAEFSQILCISVGVFTENLDRTIATISNDTQDAAGETQLLKELSYWLSDKTTMVPGGYNIKGFDIPYIIKRCLIQRLAIPKHFQVRGKKPWEVNFLDLMEDWKSLGWEAVSLDQVCMALGITSPKDKFQNYEMNTLLDEGKITIKDVIEYCEKDVQAVMKALVELIKK
jgi:hypothetical protein